MKKYRLFDEFGWRFSLATSGFVILDFRLVAFF